MSVKVLNLTKIYGNQKAVDNISFEIKTGEIVGFIGPNGAGKSTTMKIITGYIPATEGEVFVNGLNIKEKSVEIRKKIGYLPENNPLYPDMYIKEFLEFVAGIYKIKNKKQRIEEIIELVGLTPEKNKKIGQLSKGYRQRVGLAQALIHNPSVLILDEPTSGLDPNQIIEIRNLISQIGKQKTVMLSTHIMQEVEAICDRIIIIKKGKIVADNYREKLKDISKDKLMTFIVEFEKEINIQKLKNALNIEKIEKITQTKYIMQSLEDIRKTVYEYAVKNNLIILGLQKEEKSLEEIFRQLTE